jgi:hypothetical protein
MSDESTSDATPEGTADVTIEVDGIDVDGDGVADVVRVVTTTVVDVDGDGVPDAVAVTEAIGVDVDGDGQLSDDEIEITEVVAVRDDED